MLISKAVALKVVYPKTGNSNPSNFALKHLFPLIFTTFARQSQARSLTNSLSTL